jgi:diguanylate cyclase (GGDEF)-like protein
MNISEAFLKPQDSGSSAGHPVSIDPTVTALAPASLCVAADDAPPAPAPRLQAGGSLRAKLCVAFGLTGAAIALFVLVASGRQYATVEHAAILEAQHVAHGIAERAIGIGLERREELQAFVTRLAERDRRDVVILDARRTGLADANPQEAGAAFDADAGEVAQTIADGQPRTFIERNKHHPDGAHQVVVAMHAPALRGPIVGAVVLEYTPIQDAMMVAVRGDLLLIIFAGGALIVFIGALGVGLSRQLIQPLQAITEAVMRIDHGDYTARVTFMNQDELGLLSYAFNRMAGTVQESLKALRTHGDVLEQRVADRTAELRVANAALQAEIEERRRSLERSEYLAYYDSLTGLPNRAMFSKLLEASIGQAQAAHGELGLLFVDLDRFKVINDTLGHTAGDLLLQETAQRLKACLREGDAAARLGGDEFVVILRDLRNTGEVETVARKVLATASRPFVALGQEFHVTASVGVSLYPKDGVDERSLMKNADLAMYHAKDEGKNNFQFYSPRLSESTFERLTMEAALRQALDRAEFELFYQPKIDVTTGAVGGMEALLRWRHPELGMVSPARFIPLAEETGLILPIGKWVLKTACAQNVAWNGATGRPLCIAVNLSARQFADDRLFGDVVEVLRETGLAPELLELEITESMLMRDIDKAIDVLTQLKAMGVRIAIDDFGTGYSSLSNLKKFPVDTIKVDRSFVRDLPGCSEDRSITEAIIAMGRALSLTVVAEGVETDAQADFLRTHACDEFQGFLFSKPLSGAEFEKLLVT